MQDIIAGQADFMLRDLGPAAPFIKGGKMRALMLTAAQPAALLPDVPAAASIGVPLEVTSWQAIAAPAGTPPAIIQRLYQAAVKGMVAQTCVNAWPARVSTSWPIRLNSSANSCGVRSRAGKSP